MQVEFFLGKGQRDFQAAGFGSGYLESAQRITDWELKAIGANIRITNFVVLDIGMGSEFNF